VFGERLLKKRPILLIIIIVQLLVAGTTIKNHAEAQVIPTLQVPEKYLVQAPYLNETFDINVTLKDMNASSKLIGVQFRLKYNNTILEVVNVTEGSFLQDSRWDLYGTFWSFHVEDDVLYGSHVVVGNMLYPNTTTGEWDQTQFPEGSGTIATITFKVLYMSTKPNSSISCPLEFIETETTIFDGDGNEIPHNIQNGYVEITSSQFVSINPSPYNASSRGELFNITVDVNDIDARWHLIGIQFRLTYDPKLIEVVNVTEGSFLQDSRWDLYGTFWSFHVEDDVLYGSHVVVGNMLYPNTTTGEWDQTQFPEGSGTIATITFKVLQGPPSAASFTLIDTELFDPDGNEIPYNLQGGDYRFSVETLYHHIAWANQSYIVVTQSNVTVDPVPMYFDQPHRALYFNITGPEGTIGYCNVTIPKALLYAPLDQWLVIVGGQITDHQVTEDGTNTYLYFACSLSGKTVYIVGTEVVPEFPVTIIPMILLVAMLFAVVLAKFTKLKKRAESPVKSSEFEQIL
jgi:hypothetical protein